MAKLVKTSDLAPHPELGGEAFLPRLTDDEFEGLVASIAESGIMQPIVVAWPERVILDGHHRWRAAQKLGLEEVPVMTEEFLDGAAQFRLGLGLNLHRRQVTTEQKRDLVERLLLMDPEQSNRTIAVAAGVSHPTVANSRSRLENAGKVERLSTRTGSDGVRQRVGSTRAQSDRKPKETPAQRLEAFLTDRVQRPPRLSTEVVRAAVREAVSRGEETRWSDMVRRSYDFLGVVIDELEASRSKPHGTP